MSSFGLKNLYDRMRIGIKFVETFPLLSTRLPYHHYIRQLPVSIFILSAFISQIYLIFP